MPTPTAAIETLDQAREYASETRCDGCAKEGTLSAYQVRKEGPNEGRLFVKCRHCGFFGWLTAAIRADAELDQLRTNAKPCHKCGKPRQAGRVAKEGANRGRLFLSCSDPACGGFQWVSPAVGPSATPTDRPAPRDEDAFLAAIRDNPEDDLTRLVFADWLDEHDQPARAELIRVQVERGRLEADDPASELLDERAHEILKEHGAAWTAPLHPHVVGWRFARGLIDVVEVEVDQFVAHADTLFRVAGAADFHIRVTGWEAVRTLVGCKRLRHLRRLTLVGERMGGAGARILAESPLVAGLRWLALPGQSLGQPGVRALVGSRYLKELEVLDLSGNNLTLSAVPFLASTANLPRLRKLILADNYLLDSDARALANSPHLRELQELDLSGNGITREGIDAIRRSPLGARLERLAT